MAEAGFPPESCSNMCEVFKDMFPDSRIALEMNLAEPRLAYHISQGLGPYFHTKLLKGITKNNAFYSITFDEPVGTGIKQMDVYVRFWSDTQDRVQEHFLSSHSMYSVSTDAIRRKLLDAVKHEELDMSRWLMVASSSSGVSSKLLGDLDAELALTGHAGLVHIGSCNQALVHTSFRKGIDMIQHWDVDDLLDAVFKWFNKYQSKREELKDMQQLLELKELYLLRYAADEWLSIVPLICKLIDVWDLLRKYFLEYIPRNLLRLTKSPLYKTIKTALVDHATLPRLLFLKSTSEVFESFLATIQSDGLLIYSIHDDLMTLLVKLLSKFMRPELLRDIAAKKLARIDLERDANSMKLDKLEVGPLTRVALKKMKPIDVTVFLTDARKFLITVASSLREKGPLDNPILANLQFLRPSARTEAEAITGLKTLAEHMPQVISSSDIEKLEEEWKVYEADDIEESTDILLQGIDGYWAGILKRENETGEPKYPLLSTLVKAMLSLSHGQVHNALNSSPDNIKHQLGPARGGWSLGEDVRTGLKTLRSTAAQFGGAENVPITRKAISSYTDTDAMYQQMLDTERKTKEEQAAKEARERQLLRPRAGKEASILLSEKAALQQKVMDGNELVSKANDRLSKACRTKNMAEVMEAQELLDAGHRQITETSQKMSAVDEKLYRMLKPNSEPPFYL